MNINNPTRAGMRAIFDSAALDGIKAGGDKYKGIKPGDTVRLKKSVAKGADAKATAQVEGYIHEEDGGLWLKSPLSGSRGWNVDDVEKVLDSAVLDAAPKKANLNFGGQVDENRKSKEGKGKAKINAEVHAWAEKKFAGANGTSITNASSAIEKQEIKIHKPQGRMGTLTITITPLGDFLRVMKSDGTPGKAVTEFYSV